MQYKLSDKEEVQAKNFMKKHKTCKGEQGYNRPFPYKITPTGIGVAVEIICPYCHASEDITDYETW